MSDDKKPTIADRMFDGSEAQGDLETKLLKAGALFERLGSDWYDCSVELYGVPATHRLSIEAQRVIHAAGFAKAYVNHEDKWETHYSFKPEFAESKGWRVSYPHKRGKAEKGIWVEEFISDWPQDWFDTGYVLIKTRRTPAVRRRRRRSPPAQS